MNGAKLPCSREKELQNVSKNKLVLKNVVTAGMRVALSGLWAPKLV